MFNRKKEDTDFYRDCEMIGKRMHQIAGGDLERDRIQVNTKDLTALAEDVNLIADTLNIYVGEIARVLSHLSVGDLLVRVSGETEFYGDFAPIKSALEKMIFSLSDTFAEIGTIMEDINLIGEESNRVSASVADNEKRLEEHMQMVSAKASEVSKKAEENSENVSRVSQSVEHARKTAEQGDSNIIQLVESMKEVNRASNNISSITDIIFDISAQTKLLSLNASIEAARAGEHGRGFAVVAEEIGKLALQTTQAVEQTGELIRESVNRVEESQGIVQSTAECFRDITEEIENITVQNRSIVETTTGQKDNINEIVEIIEKVTETIGSNAALAEKSAGANTSLKTETDRLKVLLNAFIVDEAKRTVLDKQEVDNTAKEYIRKAETLLETSNAQQMNEILEQCMEENECFECAYVIDGNGQQVSDTVMNPKIELENLENFHPAVPGDDHSKKKYFVQAVRNQGELYVSHEYISSATKSLCCTYSRFFAAKDGRTYVVCVDMKYA